MTKRTTTIFVSALLFGGFLAGGCGDPTNADEQDMTVSASQLEDQLRQKPPFEVAQTEYRDAVQGMANQIAALTPGNTWSFSSKSWLACSGDYINTDAKHVYVMAGFTGPIPDAVWPQAVRIVKDGAAKFGATDLGTFKDEPGNHDIYLAGPDGVEFRLGTQVAASLTAKSDCRLNEQTQGAG